MNPEVLESKKGTKVVIASNLFQCLGLSNHNYGPLVRKWVRDAYEFKDGIRKPLPMKDFAKRPVPGQPMDDFYLAIELAKLIVLRSTAKDKLRLARFLSAVENNGQMSLFNQAA